MQKNIKNLTAALALLTLLTACQPTPEAEPVKQKDTMNRKLATEDADAEIKLTGVTLGLMRIREEDSPHTALLVPVWYFRGLEGKTNYYQEVLGEDKWPLCVLNAIDGSVIDSTLGY